jgi:cytochrome c biogenesis protein CcdA
LWTYKTLNKKANNPTRRVIPYLLLSVGLTLFALAGYRVFVAYPQAPLPDAAGFGLLILAATAGFASLFSPCSFPLLLTMLSHEATDVTGHASSRRRLIRFALIFSIGAATFLLLTGAFIALGAAPFIERISFTSPAGRLLRLFAGLVLIGFGWWQLQGRSLNASWLNTLLQPLWRAEAKLRRQRSTMRIGLYGFSYILIGFG